MATYSPESLGIKPPPKGFKVGGFYKGREFWGGTLSEPGEIHPLSDRPGAGGKAYVAPKDVAFIAAEREKARPTTKEGVTEYLNKFQEDLFEAETKPKVRVDTPEEIKKAVTPETGLPDLLDRSARYTELRTEYGLTDLETELADIKGNIEDEYAILRKQRGIEEGKPVALGVISGRIGEQERTAMERIDFLGRQQNRLVDELNTKYSIVGQFMKWEDLDYQDAVGRYDKEFESNLSIYKIVLGQEDKALTQYNADRAAASANLTMYANAAMKGNIDYSSLPADQKLMIQKLEVQAGLPVGFIANVKKDVDADILFNTSVSGVTQIGFRQDDGTIIVKKYGTKITGKGDEDVDEVEAENKMERILTKLGGADFFVSPEEWKKARNAWTNEKLLGTDFDDKFREKHVGNPEERGFSSASFGLKSL